MINFEKNLEKMKYIICSLLLLALNLTSLSQEECGGFLSTEGTKWEITNYSAKGKVEGITSYEISSKNSITDGYEYIIKFSSTDAKGKNEYNDEMKAYCINGVFSFDMKSKINSQQMQGFENMEMTIEADKLEMPKSNTAAGTSLKDAKISMKAVTNGITVFNMLIKITDRKVESEETKEVPAGSYECLVITQKSTTKVAFKNTESTSKDWYNSSVGVVRSEQYDKNGKLIGYSELTSFTK